MIDRNTRRGGAPMSARDFPILTIADVVAAGRNGLPDDLPESSYALLRQSAELYSERTAISFFADVETHRQTRTLSYRELFAGVTRAANLFHDLGVRPGEVVALLLPNLPETHLAMWGAEAAGIVFPLNTLLDPSTLAALLSAAGAKVLVTTGHGSELFDKTCALLPHVAGIEHVVLLGEGGPSGFLPGVSVNVFAQALGAMPDVLTSARGIASNETASYFCTGGTTGLPKIAVRTHGQVVANAWMAGSMFGDELGPDAVLFCGLPLFHVNAAVVTGLMPFLSGASVLLGTSQGYRAPGLMQRFWEIIATHAITGFSAVPTLLAALLDQPVDDHHLSSLRFAVCGAAPLSAELLHRFERSCNVAVVEGYGLTEAACVASVNPVRGEHRPGSVGLPLPAEDIRIVVLEEAGAFQREALTGEVGVVTIAGPNVFSGYLEPRHNARLWIDRGDGRRWLNTGDLGWVDAQGYLWLSGRTKDVIIRGGHNIDPAVIEEALYAHPDVALAAAIGRPDLRAGEVPVAYVQLRPGATLSADALAEHASRLIGERAAIPKAIAILDCLPLTAVGKIHKPSLRLLECAAVAKASLVEADIHDAVIHAWLDDQRATIVEVRTCAKNELATRNALAGFGFRVVITTTDPTSHP